MGNLMIKLMYITNQSDIAQHMINSGVDIIFVDIETIGKYERQGGMDTVKSDHTLSDIIKLKKLRGSFEVMIRINPLHSNSNKEIETAIENGADIIMLPMFNSADDLDRVVKLIDGRTKFIPLIETKSALKNIQNICQIDGIDTFHIGLNDLHLDYNAKFIFEMLFHPDLLNACECLKLNNKSFGLGGIGRLNDGLIPSSLILSMHYKLGSSSTIISRSFVNKFTKLEDIKNSVDTNSEISKIREFWSDLTSKNMRFFDEQLDTLKLTVRKVINND